ncbi:MAG: ATP-binding protein [Candidatus Brocadiia bacterium]
MAEATDMPGATAQESMWIEIIRHMEEIYAQLAESQAEVERRARELSEAKELADNILRSMNDALVVLDSTGRIKLVNEAAERLFGFEAAELEGRTLAPLVPESAWEQWVWRRLSKRVEAEGGLSEAEATWRDAEDRRIPVGVSGAALRNRWGEVIGAVLVVRDLRETKRRIAEARAATRTARTKAKQLEEANAELKQLQAELVQAAKMSSLGRLAAGVAHELNNPLGSILLYSDLVIEDTPEDDPRRGNLQKITRQATRCREIVRDLLDFGRPAEGEPGPVNVNAVLRNSMDVLGGQEMFHNVEIEWDMADSLPQMTGDAAQLQQAFTNIVLNAVEAMEGRGRLTVRSLPAEDDGVAVEITDTGPGIPEEDRERLFEPFFTRKDDGTGLGLAITYGIVERHRGEIEVESEVGKGTTFRVTLRGVKGGGSDES